MPECFSKSYEYACSEETGSSGWGRSAGDFFYANAVMRLFEHIANMLSNMRSWLRGVMVKGG